MSPISGTIEAVFTQYNRSSIADGLSLPVNGPMACNSKSNVQPRFTAYGIWIILPRSKNSSFSSLSGSIADKVSKAAAKLLRNPNVIAEKRRNQGKNHPIMTNGAAKNTSMEGISAKFRNTNVPRKKPKARLRLVSY